MWIIAGGVACILCFVIGVLVERAFTEVVNCAEGKSVEGLDADNKLLLVENAKLQKQLNEKTAECKRVEQAAQRLQHQEKELLDLVNLYRDRACELSDLFKSDLQASYDQQG
jgi:uncharacterized protein YlxW (UPF0749 family)